MLKAYRACLYLVLMIGAMLAYSTYMTALEGHEAMNNYQITLATEPRIPTAKETFRLSLQVLSNEMPVQKFDVVHEKPLHLIIVSDDLGEFLHVHPEYQGDGLFVLDNALLPRSANYTLFADFTPTGDVQQVVRLNIATENAEEAQPELAVSALETMAGPLNFRLDLPEQLKAGEQVTLDFHVTDAVTGDQVDTLDEYLGAAGHLVILDQTVQTYLHTHPAHDEHEAHSTNPKYGPDVQFLTEFPRVGNYAMWLQVQYEGEIYTAPFIIEVAEEATQEAHHQH